MVMTLNCQGPPCGHQVVSTLDHKGPLGGHQMVSTLDYQGPHDGPPQKLGGPNFL